MQDGSELYPRVLGDQKFFFVNVVGERYRAIEHVLGHSRFQLVFILVEVEVVGFDGAEAEHSEDRLYNRVGCLKLDGGPSVALAEIF